MSGIPKGAYFRFVAATFVSMFAGAQCVHAIYRPLDDLPEIVDKMREERRLLRLAAKTEKDKETSKTVNEASGKS